VTVGELRNAGVVLPARTAVVLVGPDGTRRPVVGIEEVLDTEPTADGGRQVVRQELRLHFTEATCSS
jgi:hypothetical protein